MTKTIVVQTHKGTETHPITDLGFIQIIDGLLYVFEKEKGAFIAAYAPGSWVSVKVSPTKTNPLQEILAA